MPVQRANSVSYGSDVQLRTTFTLTSSGATLEGTATYTLYNAKRRQLATGSLAAQGSGVYTATLAASNFTSPGRYRVKVVFVATTTSYQKTEEFDLFVTRGV